MKCNALAVALLVLAIAAPTEAAFQEVDTGAFWAVEDLKPVMAAVFNGDIYMGMEDRVDDLEDQNDAGCLVFRLHDNGSGWDVIQVTDRGFGTPNPWNSFSTADMTVYGDQLYVGIWNNVTGSELWRTRAGVIHPASNADWERVDDTGFGAFAVTSLIEFGSHLFAGTFTQKLPDQFPACNVWRSSDGIGWDKVNVDGFGNADNSDSTTMAVYDGNLYVGTENGYFKEIGFGTGCEVWRTDGTLDSPYEDDWENLVSNGFSQAGEYTGNRNIIAMTVFDGKLFVGTQNVAKGAEVWSYDGSRWDRVASGGIDNVHNVTVAYHSMISVDGALYLGMKNSWTGGEVWRYDGDHWYRINESGFGDINDATGIVGAQPVFEYNDKIYSGAIAASILPPGLFVTDVPQPEDPDNDGALGENDNCPYKFNPGQEDSNANGIGDTCDDHDGDGFFHNHDCDDTDPNIYPAASDHCDDGIDSDCNGMDRGQIEYPDDGADSNCNGIDDCFIMLFR